MRVNRRKLRKRSLQMILGFIFFVGLFATLLVLIIMWPHMFPGGVWFVIFPAVMLLVWFSLSFFGIRSILRDFKATPLVVDGIVSNKRIVDETMPTLCYISIDSLKHELICSKSDYDVIHIGSRIRATYYPNTKSIESISVS